MQQKIIKIINSKTFYISLIILCTAVIFTLRFTMLLKSNHPCGLDGYYYALQAKSLLVNHALENPDYKTGYYLCALTSFLCRNVITGCKLWAALASTLLSVSIFILLKTFSKNKIISFAGLFISGFCSPSLASFEINYINNLTGLFCFFFFASLFYALINSWKELPKNKKIIYSSLAVFFFLTAAFSHLVSLAYCFIFACLVLLRKLKLKNQIILVVFAVFCFALLFIWQKGRFNSVFSITPILPVFSKPLINIIKLPVCLEMSLYFILTYGCAVIYALIKKHFDLFLLLPVIIFFPFWKLDTVDMGYRMFLNAVPCAICFILIIIYELTKEKLTSTPKKLLIIPFAFLIILSFISKPHKIYNAKNDPPYEYYKKLVSKVDYLPQSSLLIAHLGLNHVYTYYNNLKDCLNYNCDFEVPDNEIWRLAYGVNADYLKEFFGEYEEDELDKLIKPLDSNYTLIKEELWQRYLTYEEDEIVQSLNNWYNPHEYRPGFIRRK